MYNNRKYKKKSLILLIALVCTMFINLNIINTTIFTEKSSTIKENQVKNENGENIENLKSSFGQSYTTNYNGTGKDINVTLHQSYNNKNFNTIVNVSGRAPASNNTFEVTNPIDTNYDATLINITIDNIEAPNKTIIIEDQGITSSQLLSIVYATSFTTNTSNCLLASAIFYVFYDGVDDDADIRVYLYSSTWLNKRSEPVISSKKTVTTVNDIPDPHDNYWLNINLGNTLLNSSKTENNTWFIGLYKYGGGPSDNPSWNFRNDAAAEANNSYAYSIPEPSYTFQKRDYFVNIKLTPLSNTPNATAISLKINGTAAKDIGINKGYWIYTQKVDNIGGKLKFIVSTGWWDVKCKISIVKINYTRTDLLSTESFNIPSSGAAIEWNVTRQGGFSGFQTGFEYYYINYTIPTPWYETQIWNGSTQKTRVSTRSLGNGYNQTKVLEAGNGTYWYLKAKSSNLLISIDFYDLNLNPITNAKYLDMINIRATFSRRLDSSKGSDRGTNLSIYNPQGLDSKLNYTITNSTFNNNIINIGTWDISTSVDFYGTYRAQVWWNNDTAAGFREKTLTVIGNTDLLLISPVNESIYQTPFSDFNITVLFNDTGQDKGIDGNSYYKNGTIHGSLKPGGQTGYYNLTIKPCDFTIGKHTITINATKEYYDNQTIDFIFYKAINNNTELLLIGPANNSYYKSPFTVFNITVFFNDTLQKNGIDGASFFKNGTIHGQLKSGGSIGYFNLTINPENFNYGINVIRINATKDLYANRTIYFSFHKVIGTQLKPGNSQTLPSVYRGKNQSFVFNYTNIYDQEVNNADVKLIGADYGFTWNYYQNGANNNYTLWLNSTKVTNGGTFKLRFNASALGNETQFFNLTITVNLPNANIGFKENVYDLKIDIGKNVTLHFNFTNAQGIAIKTLTTNGNVNVTNLADGQFWNRLDATFPNGGFLLINHGDGNYTLNISTGGSLAQAIYHLRVNISYYSPNPGPYNNTLVYITFTYGTPTPTAPGGGDGGGGGGGGTTVTGFTWGDILLWIIIAACVGGSVAAIVGIKKGVIAPKKRERERVLREVTTVFDDAVNLEHLLVIYKNTGTCVFFKSYGMEEIDPQLISGFLSAVSSFGKEMDSQEALNEIQYGDKMLLLADGQYIRVALVLDKQASTILRQHLKEFIETFEKIYSNELPKWKGQIDLFKDTGDFVDSMFHTSIILPHEIKYDIGKVKSLKNPSSREVLKVAQGLVEGSERKFFFVASLLMEAVDKTGRDKAEIFMGIKELTEKCILLPIRIAAIEEKEVSQQELNLIRQKISELPGLTEEEINTIAKDLAKMSPVEREAYLTSYRESAKIVSAPMKSKSGAKVIDNVKSAKKEINSLKKSAVKEIKRKDVTKAIEIYRSASVIATNWDLTREFEELEDTVRITQIDGLKELKNILESEARTAEKGKDYRAAIDKYNQASKVASEIFKLGITEMTKEVKRLTNKAKELGKLI